MVSVIVRKQIYEYRKKIVRRHISYKADDGGGKHKEIVTLQYESSRSYFDPYMSILVWDKKCPWKYYNIGILYIFTKT